ncbi:hypothetical protein BAUCODRAFT_30318 [Baudoinia panamericana UAMH 10762]|uniref:Uncharacterized protein n=1 Tax=Baudoinia panamericana (strain UAMH 10762) TaxID=717646 RepID=M2NL72_BAUPA|nr:uncharacterized protein BAUCODRAFT_30318 [Baudoinia panamericana UAMH 10762]EMC99900.1 hypothetical protein BAUCODRAFT_30318 [Baudoinia panamericana UAMH 10762]
MDLVGQDCAHSGWYADMREDQTRNSIDCTRLCRTACTIAIVSLWWWSNAFSGEVDAAAHWGSLLPARSAHL